MNDLILKDFRTCVNCLWSVYRTRQSEKKATRTLYQLICTKDEELRVAGDTCQDFVKRADREAPVFKCERCLDSGMFTDQYKNKRRCTCQS